MATKKAAATTQEEAPGPTAAPAPTITDFVSVWVHHTQTALAKNQTGFIFATRADAAQMIADGDAVAAGDLSFSGPMIGPRPAPPPPPPPPPPAPPPEEDGGPVNGDSEIDPEPEPDPEPESATISDLRAGASTWTGPGSVTPDTFWNNRNQTQVVLSNVQGNPDAVAVLEGQTVGVTVSHGGSRFNLQIDTTGLDLAGLTLVATSV